MLIYVVISLKMTKHYIIYQIKALDNNLDFSYVGSTENFIKRKSNHKTFCNNVNKKNYNKKLYQFIRKSLL
jgi:hypothetical protein